MNRCLDEAFSEKMILSRFNMASLNHRPSRATSPNGQSVRPALECWLPCFRFPWRARKENVACGVLSPHTITLPPTSRPGIAVSVVWLQFLALGTHLAQAKEDVFVLHLRDIAVAEHVVSMISSVLNAANEHL